MNEPEHLRVGRYTEVLLDEVTLRGLRDYARTRRRERWRRRGRSCLRALEKTLAVCIVLLFVVAVVLPLLLLHGVCYLLGRPQRNT